LQHPPLHRPSRQTRQHWLLYSGNESGDEGGPVSKAEDSDNKSTLQQRLGRYWTVFKTASIAFVSGSMSAFILSIILFNQSFDYNPASEYRSADYMLTSLPARTKTSASESSQIQQSVTLYRSILETLTSSYVDDINTDEMLETSVDSMLSTLDPYSEYLSQKELSKRKNLVGIGLFVMKSGIGSDAVTLDGKSASTLISGIPSAIKLPTQLLDESQSQNKQTFKVVLSLEGYAYDAGLRVGDELISIDGQSITGDDASTMPSLEEVRELLVGVPGTKVKIQFTRPGSSDVQTIDVERKVVQFSSVPCAFLLKQTNDGGYIGYIRLRRFGTDAGESMRAAIQSLQNRASQGENPTPSQLDNALTGLVLDLRDNTGGELIEAIKVASIFVPDNTYLGSSKGEGSMIPDQSYYSGKLDLTQFGYPSQSSVIVQETNQQMIDPDKTHIVILTNRKTASASEFLAGVFQDLDLGVIVGNDRETLGKGIGQRELPLPFSRALKITYHEFYTPSGRCVQRQYKENKSKQSPRRRTQSNEVFYTANGRKISDRMGVQVDLRVRIKQSLLSDLLSSSGAYYKYASDWYANHPHHPSAKIFGVDNKTYKDFQSFVSREQQRGNIKLEEVFDDKHILQQMELISKSSNQRDLSLKSTARLKEEIVKDLLKDFDASKDIIKAELELNLLARDLPDSVLLERSAKSDELVKEAVKLLLENNNSYDAILNKSVK
jgi:carboxyl-terminal processing protease